MYLHDNDGGHAAKLTALRDNIYCAHCSALKRTLVAI